MEGLPLNIPSGQFQATLQDVLRAFRKKTPEQIRAVLTHSNFTGNSVEQPPEIRWHDMFHGANSIVDLVNLKEFNQFHIIPVKPGGRILRRMTYARTLLRAAGSGSATVGINPTMDGEKLDPVFMRAKTVMDESAIADLQTDLSAIMDQPIEPEEMRAMVDSTVDNVLAYAALGSLVNLNINGDTHGGAGLNLYDGILHQLDAGAPVPYSLGSTAYLATVFPAMWDAFAASASNPELLDADDLMIACNVGVLQAYKSQVLAATTDVRGGYDKETKKVNYLTAEVCGFRDLAVNRIILTTRSNLPIGLINSPLKVEKEWSLALDGVWIYSVPLHAHGLVVDISNVVYAKP